MKRKPEHCEKHSEYESYCLSCVCAEESYLENENDRLRASIAELEKKLNEARKDAKFVAFAANTMMQLLEHRDYPNAVAILEKYK